MNVCIDFIISSFIVVDCGPLTNPDNGQVVTSHGTTFGSTATYTCDTGYTLSGSQTRTCGADGVWTLFTPVCEGTYTNTDAGIDNHGSGYLGMARCFNVHS